MNQGMEASQVLLPYLRDKHFFVYFKIEALMVKMFFFNGYIKLVLLNTQEIRFLSAYRTRVLRSVLTVPQNAY